MTLQETKTDIVNNYSSANNRSWGINSTNGATLYLFGKIRCDPNRETIKEIITKIREKYPKIKVKHQGHFISVIRSNSNEQINFVPREDDPTIPKRMSSQNKSNCNEVYFGWHSKYEILQNLYWSKKEKEDKFDKIAIENTQGLIRKDLLLD